MSDLIIDARPLGLSARPAAYSVIDRCLDAQARSRPRSWIARQLGFNPLAPEARNWYRVATSEIEVATTLQTLGNEWTVLHSIPIGSSGAGADVDHLLIGPAGVFTITTKIVHGHMWVGRRKILVDGQRQDYVLKSEREARRVHRLLGDAIGASVFVRPVLVFVRPGRVTVRESPASVTVLESAQLVPWLSAQRAVYPAARVSELVAAADRATTWRHSSMEQSETRRQLQRFERLQSEVADAGRRWKSSKLAASLLALAALAGAAAATIPVVLGLTHALG